MERRDFFKLAGVATVAAAGASLGGCGGGGGEGNAAAADAAVAGWSDVNFEQEVDVLIVGAGPGGLLAAYHPAKAGLKTLVVDKSVSYGGDGMHSAACQWYFGSKYDVENRGGMNTEETLAAYKDFFQKYPRPDFVEQIFANTGEVHDLLSYDFGVEWQPKTEGAYYATCYVPAAGLAETKQEFTAIYDGVTAAGAEFMFDQRARHMIVDPEGRVVGVRFESQVDGRWLDIKAKYVLLATGSFCANQEMIAKYLPKWSKFGSLVSASTGDGHLLGQSVGAAFEGVGEYVNLNTHSEAIFVPQMFGPSISVLPTGKRFYDEIHCHQGGQACIDAGYGNFWSIWDEAIENGPNKTLVATAGDEKITANTIEELAEAIQVPVENLKATFEEYDKACETGQDPAFNREYFLQKLNPPYYAFNNHPVRYMTKGGLKTNLQCQVLREDDSVIEGLYAGGLLGTGSFSKEFATSAVCGYYAGKCIVEAAGATA